MRHTVASLLLFAPLLAQDRSPDDLLKLPVPGATRIAYGTGALAERYREGSPIEMLPLKVPQEIFAGRMFATQTKANVEAAKREGDAVNATIAEKAGHFVFIDPGSSTWPHCGEGHPWADGTRDRKIEGGLGSMLFTLALASGACG